MLARTCTEQKTFFFFEKMNKKRKSKTSSCQSQFGPNCNVQFIEMDDYNNNTTEKEKEKVKKDKLNFL